MFDQVAKFISTYTEVPVEGIHPDSDIVRDLGLSSFHVAELVVHCEEEFGVNIPDRKIKYLSTVGDVVAFLETKKE